MNPSPAKTALRIGLLFGTWLMLALCDTAAAQDDPPGRVGRIGELQGEVWVFDDEQGDWVAAQRNRPLTQGDRLSTAATGRVELGIGSTTVLLDSGAELEAVLLNDDSIQLQLHRGSLALRLRSSEVAAELQVFTGEGRFAFQRSGLYRIDRYDDTSRASVWRGDLSFQTDDFLLPLQAGQAAEFWREGAQRAVRSRWLTPQNDDFAQAALQSDRGEERSASARYVSPEMTGVEDLDRHGRWQNHPEYGAVWMPTVVSVGWAPYRHGHWAWLRPWGWTWVDDAAWGFAPFHYGRWLWWGSRWCWTPGPRVARPVYAPALVGWVGDRGQFSVNVAGRPVPAVGWVPLAPRESYRPGYRSSAGYLDRINVGRAHPHGPAPEFGNRHVPGAVTLLPAQSLQPREPVPGVPRGDRPRQPGDRFNPYVPGRPVAAAREHLTPRVSSPLTALPTTPQGQPAAEVGTPQREAGNRPGWPVGNAAADAQPPRAPRMPQVVTAPPTAPVPQMPQAAQGSPPAAPGQPVPQAVPNRSGMPAAPGSPAGADVRQPRTAPNAGPGGTPNAVPGAPARAAFRPFQPPTAVAVPAPVPGPAAAPAQAAVAAPPAAIAPPAPQRAAAVPPPQPARVDSADARAAGSGDAKPMQPTMRTPQSRYNVRER